MFERDFYELFELTPYICNISVQGVVIFSAILSSLQPVRENPYLKAGNRIVFSAVVEFQQLGIVVYEFCSCSL